MSKEIDLLRFGMKINKRHETEGDSPGPAAYQRKSIFEVSTPGTKFSRSKRGTRNKTLEEVPGPGNYSPKKEFVVHQTPKYTFGTEKKIKKIL
jgi:hypothetical protein